MNKHSIIYAFLAVTSFGLASTGLYLISGFSPLLMAFSCLAILALLVFSIGFIIDLVERWTLNE